MTLDPCVRWRDQLNPWFVRALRPVARALGALHPTQVEGLENLPDGPALLVGNHGLLGYETLLFFESIYASTGRIPRGLADRWFFRVPLMRDILVRVGGMYGAPKNAHDSLTAGQWVVCYPGGAREVLKSDPALRYRLRWEQATGFVRVALRAGVPIIPFAAAGVDDTFAIVSKLRGSGKLLMGDAKYDLPLLMGMGLLPAPVPFWFRFGKPIRFDHGPDAANDDAMVTRLRDDVWRDTQSLLDGLVEEWGRDFRRDNDAYDLPRMPELVVGF